MSGHQAQAEAPAGLAGRPAAAPGAGEPERHSDHGEGGEQRLSHDAEDESSGRDGTDEAVRRARAQASAQLNNNYSDGAACGINADTTGIRSACGGGFDGGAGGGMGGGYAGERGCGKGAQPELSSHASPSSSRSVSSARGRSRPRSQNSNSRIRIHYENMKLKIEVEDGADR